MKTRECVGIEREGEAAIITMRRPDKRNALSLAMMRELEEALVLTSSQDGVRTIILAGEGPAFSAGHDLRELCGGPEPQYVQIFEQ